MKRPLATIAAAMGIALSVYAATINLANVTGDTVLQDGDVATGILVGNNKISVAANATVVLRDAVIDQDSGWDGWASVNCLGDATVVLEGENTLKSMNSRYPAIHVPVNKTLTIRGSGSLAAWGGNSSAAIGGGNEIDCGNIVIADGTITATVLGRTAGIGSGASSICGNITISGGTVTTGVKDFACMWSNGIGAGMDGSCGDILISGGTVYAQGNKGAGIGSGCCCFGNSSCGTITISGGDVTAISDAGAAAIGSASGIVADETSYYSVCGNITISGGTVNATIFPGTLREYSCVGIGSGCINASCGSVTIGLGITRVTATSVYPGFKGECGIPIGAAEDGNGTCGTITIDPRLIDKTHETAATADPDIRTLTRTIEPRIIHLDAVTPDMLVGNELIVRDGSILTGLLEGGYKVSIWNGATVTLRTVCIEQRDYGDFRDEYPWAGITCRGDATIILEGANTVMGLNEDDPGIYVPVGKTLTIRGGGDLYAFPGYHGCGAAIGASTTNSCGNIVIEGGTIVASVSGHYGYFAAGIGGTGADCGFIEIKGGNVTAVGGEGAAGIGGGLGGRCRGISIGSGIETVFATAGYDCENPIGAGNLGSCGGVTIGFGLKREDGMDDNERRTCTIGPNDVDLARLSGLEPLILKDGEIATGRLIADKQICIADGATVMLRDVSINPGGHNSSSTPWAGITCLGNATIILDDANLVKGCNEYWPGIYVPTGKTLTIQGEGALTAAGVSFYGAGIGGGHGASRACGNIVIESGTVTAMGGGFASGIGSGFQSSCGDITISGGIVTATGRGGGAGIGGGNDGDCGSISITGGTVEATGGENAAGIGSGFCYEYGGCCGYITIGPGIARVVATAGDGCENPIGADDEDLCDGISVSTLLSDNHGKPTRTIEGGISAYSSWAAANSVRGTWDAKDANGIHNVFRYAFNKPTGDFTLLAITFNEVGKAVIVTPPLVNGKGFAFSVVASDTVNGTGDVATTPLDPLGETVIDERDKTKRFFRLRAEEME